MKLLIVLVSVVAVAAMPQKLSTVRATYSDDFARNKAFPLAAAAYSSNPQHCLDKKYTNAKLSKQVFVKCDAFKNDICSGYVAVLDDDKAIVLSFRGTQGFLQLVEEANKSVFESQMKWFAGGEVSKYFGDAFTSIWNAGLKDQFSTAIAQNPTYAIWVTGHSLGGSIASLAASYIVGTGIVKADNVQLVTYGQPRTGDKTFAADHDAQIPNSFRVTHWRDVVPHIPNEGFEGYHHHKFEVFYKDSMKSGAKFTVCAGEEDDKCSDGLWITTSISDHLHYFEHDVSDWGEKGCN